MLTALATTTALAHGPGWGGPGLGVLLFLVPLFWIGIVVLVVALSGRRWRRRWAGSGGPAAGGPGAPWAHGFQAARSAEATLAERFAQGDIDEQEYRARLEVIRANAPQPPAGR